MRNVKDKTTIKHILWLIAVVIIIVWLSVARSCTAEPMAAEKATCTIYKIGDNSITKEIDISTIGEYVNSTYEWSLEPTTLLYSSDGWSSWICNSEVDTYLATGKWFTTKPINVTMNPFEKTNLSPEELEKVLTKGLSGYGQAFYNIEQTYGINSIFAISVAELESGNGTSSAFRNKNNAFGIGPGRYFNSVEACIEYFGQLMNKPIYYGKSIDRIGSVYCVGGNWASKVKTLMKTNYSDLGL